MWDNTVKNKIEGISPSCPKKKDSVIQFKNKTNRIKLVKLSLIAILLTNGKRNNEAKAKNPIIPNASHI